MSGKRSYVKIPNVLLEKKLSLRAVYMYAKILMLTGKGIYNRECWVTNRFSGKREMSIDALSDITRCLVEKELLRVVPQSVKGSAYKTNTYEQVPISGNYKPVYNDYINHVSLSAEAKGLGILLCLLKSIPTSNSGISKAIGISSKTVKKYIDELIESGIYIPETSSLDVDSFPYEEQVTAKSRKRYMDAYESWLRIPAEKLSKRERRQRAYLEKSEKSPIDKARIYVNTISTGLMGPSKKQKVDTTDKKDIIL